MLVAVAIAAFCSTLLGGFFALRLRDRLHLILGFSAGAVVAVAFFDLIPEALDLGAGTYEPSSVLSVVALGFLIYLVLDRMLLMHSHAGEEHGAHADRGAVGAGTLSLHSFLDGVGIGLAFEISTAVGVVVAVAVLAHDFSDGINTVNFVLKNGGSWHKAFRWLLLDALAPVLGILSTLFFVLSAPQLALALALFGGFFLYIGASDLIPESHHAHPTILTTALTVAGALVLYVVIRLAGI
ncbi:permease [Candidatus Kaiserbacteria bacterium]|nr:permease [Candidatus Kaiserbacteria bacterium]